jgi:hypothetical protein
LVACSCMAFLLFFPRKNTPRNLSISAVRCCAIVFVLTECKIYFLNSESTNCLLTACVDFCCCFSFLLSVLAALLLNTVWTPQWIMHVWWGIGCFPRQSTKQVSRWRDESYPSKTKLKLNDQLRLVARVCSHSADRPFARISFPCLSCFLENTKKQLQILVT